MDEAIPYIDGLGEELVRAIGRRPHRVPVARRRLVLASVALLVLLAAPAAAIAVWSPFGPSTGQLEAERGGTLIPDSFRVLRTVEEPRGITWTVVTYETTKYECLDIYGGITGSETPAGAVGGCGGLSELGSGNLIVGGLGGDLRVGSDLFSLVGGEAAPSVATVRATFSDGRTVLDRPTGGIWLFVSRPGQSPSLVEALDDQGRVVSVLTLTRDSEP